MKIGKLLNPVYIYHKRDRILPSIKQVAIGYAPLNLREKIPWSTYMSFKNYVYYKDKLKKFKDIHKGERCFLIGTGPSLNKTDFSLIKDEILFGVNTLYKGLSKFSINCEYWAVTDPAVWQEHFENILGLDTTLFLSCDAGESYLSNKNYSQKFQKNEPIIIRHLGFMWIDSRFSKDLSCGAYNGDTVIIDICLQAAYYMGFKEVYLLGCDCDYSGLHRFDGLKSENITTPAIEGDFSRIFKSYEICKKVYEKDGREIINATVDGKLEIFERKKLEDVL